MRQRDERRLPPGRDGGLLKQSRRPRKGKGRFKKISNGAEPRLYLLFLLFKLVVVDKEGTFLWTGDYFCSVTRTCRTAMLVCSPALPALRVREQLRRARRLCG